MKNFKNTLKRKKHKRTYYTEYYICRLGSWSSNLNMKQKDIPLLLKSIQFLQENITVPKTLIGKNISEMSICRFLQMPKVIRICYSTLSQFIFCLYYKCLGIEKKSTNERKCEMTMSFYYIFLVNMKKGKCRSTVMEVFKIEIL